VSSSFGFSNNPAIDVPRVANSEPASNTGPNGPASGASSSRVPSTPNAVLIPLPASSATAEAFDAPAVSNELPSPPIPVIAVLAAFAPCCASVDAPAGNLLTSAVTCEPGACAKVCCNVSAPCACETKCAAPELVSAVDADVSPFIVPCPLLAGILPTCNLNACALCAIAEPASAAGAAAAAVVVSSANPATGFKSVAEPADADPP